MTNPAGFWRRLAASLLDGLVISIPVAIIAYIATGNLTNDNISSAVSILYTLLLPLFWTGYTVGKRIMGVRIAKVNGDKLGIGTMLLRTVVAGIVYVVTLGIGLIVSAFMVGLRADKRGLHDLIAGTYVTRNAPHEDHMM